MTLRTLGVVSVVAILVISMVAPGALASHADGQSIEFSVTQDETFAVTINVTNNGSAVAGADVVVNATDGNYTGNGSYVTDENGTVELPAPSTNVTVAINVSAPNGTASDTFTLTAPESGNASNGTGAAFGQLLSTFILELGDVAQPRGLVISSFVLDHNPGNPPAHAGPPADHPLANNTLDLTLNETGSNATITVTANGSAAVNATVNVSTLGQGQNFTGEGNYTTDQNGTVTFGLPETPTHISVTASYNNSSVTETFQLSGTQTGPPENAGPTADDDDQGPPEDAGSSQQDKKQGSSQETGSSNGDTDDGAGPPNDPGPPGDAGSNDSGNGSDGGPPSDPGPPN